MLKYSIFSEMIRSVWKVAVSTGEYKKYFHAQNICAKVQKSLESHSRIKWGMLYCVIDELLQYEGECRIPQFLSQTQHLWNVIIWMPQHWIWSTCTCKSIHKVQLWNWIWVTVSAGTHPLVFRTYKRTRKATSLCGWLCVQKDDQVLARGECN